MSEDFDEMFDEGDKRNVFSQIFKLKKILGKGSFGTVVSAIQLSNQKEVAVKIFHKAPQNKPQYIAFLKEAEILEKIKHPNIVKFDRLIESETRAFLVLELIKGGQLQDYIVERYREHRPIEDHEAATIMKAIFSGLQEIHMKDVIHRDLKPQNILLADKENLESIKICDFGLAAQFDPTQQMSFFNTRCGTKIFMAPELWQRKQYSKPVDMWSCAIIMYMVLSGGKHPVYESSDSEETYWAKIESAAWEFPPSFNKYSKDLFLKLVADPISRYSIEQVQNHPWITRRFGDDIPLTSPQKIRAFSQSQTYSRILKSMYLLYNLPGLNNELDADYHLKVLEANEQNELRIGQRRPSFVDSFRVLFGNVQTEGNETTLTTAASNPGRDGNSSPNLYIHSQNTQLLSPFLAPSFASPQLLPIPEHSMTQKETENTPSAAAMEDKVKHKVFFNDDNFSLPMNVELRDSSRDVKKYQPTISIIPVKYEESTDTANSKNSSPYQKPAESSVISIEDNSLRKSIRIKKASIRETESSFKPTKNFLSANGSSNQSSNVPSPTSRASNAKKAAKKYYFKNPLDMTLLEKLKLSHRREDKPQANEQKSKVLDSPHNKSLEDNLEEPIVQSILLVPNTSSPETSKSPQKNRTPLMRRTSRTPKPEESKPRDQGNVRLPSITLDNRGRNSSVLRSRPGESRTRVNESAVSNLSSSPMKTLKDWTVIKDAKSNTFVHGRSSLKPQFGSLLEANFYQTVTKK